MTKITVNLPNRPKGSMVGIPGLGRFENGKEYDVDDKVLRRHAQRKGYMQPKTVFGEPLKKAAPKPPETTESATQTTKEEGES